MKGFAEMVDVSTDKKAQKLNESLMESGCGQLYAQMMAEVNGPYTRDFPRFRVLVTENYVCNYNSIKQLRVYDLRTVENVYRTNMFAGHYNFDQMAVALEAPSFRELIALQALNPTLPEYAEMIAFIKSHLRQPLYQQPVMDQPTGQPLAGQSAIEMQ